MKKSRLFINLTALFLALLYCQICNAASNMEKGLALFNKRDYKNAIGYFIQQLRDNPRDFNALYYEAVTFHQLKEYELAKEAYRRLIRDFPTAPGAKNAQAALMYLDPAYARQIQRQQGGLASVHTESIQGSVRGSAPGSGSAIQITRGEPDAVSSDLASLPDQARVPYHREGQNLVVTTYINGRPIEMFFDSGAESVVLKRSELEALGIKAPTGQHFAMSYGVGEGGGQKTWLTRATLKVGQVERKNFPLHVQEDPPSGEMGHPLLGQSFFKDFSYTLDPSPDGTRGTILFQKKTPSRSFAANDSSVIPFTNMGKEIVVSVEINGRKIPMFFDTGAELCVFTKSQFAALGMQIPEDAHQGIDQGIAGNTASYRFTVPRMQLGPIIKTDVNISVIENGAMPYPLLGNSFLHDLRMDVDNSTHQMRVRR